MIYYVQLAIAIVGEVIGSNLLKLSNGFAKPVWGFTALLSYGVCFYFASLAMRGIKLNLAYATWGGVGIILTCIVSYLFFHESASPWQLFGIALIVVGVFIANFASN